MFQLEGFERDFIYADINAGVEYERAVRRLNVLAGRALRCYHDAKVAPDADAARIEALREAYREALQKAKALSPTDEEAIRQILQDTDLSTLLMPIAKPMPAGQ